jgi:hypothetical protein
VRPQHFIPLHVICTTGGNLNSSRNFIGSLVWEQPNTERIDVGGGMEIRNIRQRIMYGTRRNEPNEEFRPCSNEEHDFFASSV